MEKLTKREILDIVRKGREYCYGNIMEAMDEYAKQEVEWQLKILSAEDSPEKEVKKWLVACFGETIAGDKVERNYRFLEEALELVQSLNCTKEDAHKLVDYVFDRPIGDPHQEMGGVMVTLAALSSANNLEMMYDFYFELRRINSPEIMEKIRKKQAAKKIASSPLP